MNMEKHLEIRSSEHKGINVIVKIDYDAGTISLVERQPNSSPAVYAPKQWVFKNREVGYMQGWIDILEAMTFAVADAKADLDKFQKAKEKRKDDIIKDIVLKKKK